MDLNDRAFSKYSRSIEKHQNLLESRDALLLQLHRVEISGDQAKIKEYTKGLNTLNKEIWYQENHNPMLNEALKVQEALFNQQNQ